MLNIHLIIIQILLVVLVNPDKAVNQNSEVPDKYGTITELNSSAHLLSFSSHNLENDLPAGYVKDGSVDYTIYIQSAINKHENLTFPDFPLLINDSGLKISSNRTITFLKGSELRLKPSIKKGYEILDIKNANNVTLYNPVIKGDRFSHLGNMGEWGMGISIKGSSNIAVSGARITNCWGDGVYLGEGKTVNKNITLKNVYCKNNRRDGFSIIAVDGLKMESPYAGYSNGTLPMSGINFEPNGPDNELKNIVVTNPVTEFNKGYGIQISLSNLFGKNDKAVDFTITNHIDLKSASGFKISCYQEKKKGFETISGYLTLVDPFWKQNNVKPISTALFSDDIVLTIKNPKVEIGGGKLLSKEATRELLTYKKNINPAANYRISF